MHVLPQGIVLRSNYLRVQHGNATMIPASRCALRQSPSIPSSVANIAALVCTSMQCRSEQTLPLREESVQAIYEIDGDVTELKTSPPSESAISAELHLGESPSIPDI